MMPSRRREQGGSSGELDVFGATSYFAAGLPPAPDDDDYRRPSSATEPPSADRLYFQANAERHANNKQLMQVVAAATKRRQPSSGKSKLAALLSFMVSPSPSPRASFRKEEKKQETPPTTRRRPQAEAVTAAGGERETAAPSSCSRESSGGMQLQGLFGAHDDELDLGVATGDRRLQGVTVVRGVGGGEERWVVRCVAAGPGGGAWDEEEHREKMLDGDVDAAESASSSEQNINKDGLLLVEVEQRHGDDANIDPARSWDSDSSSDLFDLDLEYR